MIVRTAYYLCNRCKVRAKEGVPKDWSQFSWDNTQYDLCPECTSDAQTFLNDVEAFSHVEDGECPMHVRCGNHGFFHGAEATELREGIEKILESRRCRPGSSIYVLLQGLLEKVDARDSLAYAEIVEKEKQCAGS